LFAPTTLRLGRALVSLPPGAFVQASPIAEAEMVELVCEGVGKSKRVADLFSGLGTFSFALAERATVDAYESSAEALAALSEAARHATRLKPMRTHRRDLLRDPLGWRELKDFDAVVFDPPRAGAAAQAAQLAKSKVKHVAAVSCNPATLARDLRLLVDGGYEISQVVPIDQFLYSSHIEVVAHLAR
jgi:23S rRNA (uracil1939-C5)-methyltransferase